MGARAESPGRAELGVADGRVDISGPAASWSEAYAIAKELQAPVLRGKPRQLMDQHGVRLPPAQSTSSDLTGVQVRIVELVEQGITNRQIARDLRMSWHARSRRARSPLR